MVRDTSVLAALAAQTKIEKVEEGLALASIFGADGLIPCITAAANGKTLQPIAWRKPKGNFLNWKRAKLS